MTQFDWQTEEDDLQGDLEDTAVSTQKKQPESRLRLLLFILGVGALLLLLGIIVSFQIRKRSVQATDQITENLFSSYSLLQESVMAEDQELVRLGLFPANKWRETQQELMARHLFWNRSAFGLWLDLETFDAQDMSQIEVDYTPDLQQAEVTAVLPYVTEQEDGSLTRLSLQRTAVYRLVDGGWQYAPYPDGFWGESVAINGRNLALNAPSRDEEISKRLAADIDDKIDALCATNHIDCPLDAKIEINFHINADALLLLSQISEIRTLYRGADGRIVQIDMPTPTLVGLPLDEAGYDALYEGYATYIIVRLLAYSSGQLAINPEALDAVGLAEPNPAGFHPQGELIAAPVAWPEQDIWALCQQDGSQKQIARYAPTKGIWTTAYVTDEQTIMQMVPMQGEGVIFTEGAFSSFSFEDDDEDETQQQVLKWLAHGNEQIIDVSYEGIVLSSVFPAGQAEDENLILGYYKGTGIGMDWSEKFVQIDSTACLSNATCVFETVTEVPMYSPERQRSLVRMNDSAGGAFNFWLGDGEGNRLVELGNLSNSVWDGEDELFSIALDETALVHFSFDETTADGVQREQLLTNETVAALLREHDIWDQAIIVAVLAANEYAEDKVLLYVIAIQGGLSYQGGYLLEYDLQSGEVDWFEPFASVGVMPNVQFSPNGRFLQIIEIKEDVKTLHLYDVENDKLQSYRFANTDAPIPYLSSVDWSADGNWLVIAGDEGLHLIAPSAKYERQIFYPEEVCNTAVWVNKNGG